MRNILLLLILLNVTPGLKAQQEYCDFEGTKVIYFGDCSGRLDTIFANPYFTANDSSAHCARYIRDTNLYDNIKIYTNSKMENVDQYTDNSFSAPRIKMKLYSTAPVGTPVEIQLGSSLNNNYPGGVHSEYTAYTTIKNSWQNLSFNFVQVPVGGVTTSANLDKMVILFHPGSSSTDTVYFDEIIGPSLLPSAIAISEGTASFKLFQNVPNPAKEMAHINLQLNTYGHVSLKLYDMVGNPVITMLDQIMKPGVYSIPVETGSIPDGIYFYTLKKDGVSRSMKMIVSK